MSQMSVTSPNRGPVLSVRDLKVWYGTPRGAVRAVDGVSFDLARGETLGLVGESGCGKSTLGRGVLGLLPTAAKTAGSVSFQGQELVGASIRQLRRFRRPCRSPLEMEPPGSSVCWGSRVAPWPWAATEKTRYRTKGSTNAIARYALAVYPLTARGSD